MNKIFKSKRLDQDMLEDLRKNEGKKYSKLNDFIINNFGLVRDQYEGWLYEGDLRVYEDIDYDTVVDSWFYVQHFDSTIDVKEDTFEIIPPQGYEDSYAKDKLIYPNTKEGLIEAFFATCMSHCVTRVNMYGKDLFICIDEI